MRHIKALLPLSLASLGAAEIVGQWTAWILTRTCSDDGSSCIYHLALDQNPQAKTDLSSCVWTVVSTNPFKPANQTDFAKVKCGDRLSLNGGWSKEGFFTIVPTDTVARAYAFFGFTEEEIQNGKVATPRQRPAYRVGSFSEGEHPDLGLGILNKMKSEKGSSLGPNAEPSEKEPYRGPFYCIHHPDAARCHKMEKSSSPVNAPASTQQQSDSSTHKMNDMMKTEKRSTSLNSDCSGKPWACPTYCIDYPSAPVCVGKMEKKLSILEQQIMLLHNSNRNRKQSASSQSFIDSCTRNCTTDQGRYDTLSCLLMCHEQIHDAKINADMAARQTQSRSRRSVSSREHTEASAVSHTESQNNHMEQSPTQETWQIRSLTRLTNYPLNITLFTFSILSTTRNPASVLAHCTVDIPSSSPTRSWYGQRCDPINKNIKHTVGWGYKQDTDSAVMTVCHPGTGMAWFGWDGVAGKGKGEEKREMVFGDSKVERVHDMVCT